MSVWYITRIVIPFGLLIVTQDLLVAYATGGGSLPASILPWPLLILAAGLLAGWRSRRARNGLMVGATIGLLGVLGSSLEIRLLSAAYPYFQSSGDWFRIFFSLATGWVPIGAIIGGLAGRVGAELRERRTQQRHAR